MDANKTRIDRRQPDQVRTSSRSDIGASDRERVRCDTPGAVRGAAQGQRDCSTQRALRLSHLVVLSWVLVSTNGLMAADTVVSPNAQVPYLGLHGTFTLDPTAVSARDPRNPKRIVFQQMETFSFYTDMDGKMPMAQGCRYAYKGAAGDPFYYPEKSTASIWDLFALVSGDAACAQFRYVALRAPHGNPVHMHLRYGDASSGFEQLLGISLAGPEDKTKINPWWSVYCAEGTSGCDK
jgi:hypothetical protein